MEKPKAPSQQDTTNAAPISDNEASEVSGGIRRRALSADAAPISDGDAGGISGGRARQAGDDDDLEELEVQR